MLHKIIAIIKIQLTAGIVICDREYQLSGDKYEAGRNYNSNM
jgi:hypothetical protein